jgi:transposase
MSVVVDSLRGVKQVAVFTCVRCRFVGHADHNAAINIAARGVDRWGEVMRPYAAPTLTASEGGSSEPIGDSELADKPDARPLVTSP